MTSSIHPEYLFDLERQATLTESERALRDQHLESCSICRLEHGFRSDFARESLESAEDRALLERAVQGALSTVTLPPAPKRLGRWAVPSAIGAGLLAAGLAAAAVRGQRAPLAVAPPVPPELVRPVLVPLPVVQSPSSASVVASAAPERATAHVVATTAAQLFARANSARRAGETPEAVRLYRRLLSEFPASREARTSEVTMARLLLDTQGDAAEALGLLERYVRAAPQGNLAEEARLGRAEALARLGRVEEEAAAWAELLQHFPATVHRGRAEARLREVAPSAP